MASPSFKFCSVPYFFARWSYFVLQEYADKSLSFCLSSLIQFLFFVILLCPNVTIDGTLKSNNKLTRKTAIDWCIMFHCLVIYRWSQWMVDFSVAVCAFFFFRWVAVKSTRGFNHPSAKNNQIKNIN